MVKHAKESRPRQVVIMLAFVVVGVVIIARSFAGIGTKSVEPEAGSKSSSITTHADIAAAGGSYIRFKQNGSAPSGTFTVQGGNIIGPDGKRFVPIGANVGAFIKHHCYAFYFCGQSATGHADDALEWGWNMVRLNVVTDVPADVTLQETLNGVYAVIDEYTAKGIVVMPNSHSVTGSNTPMTDAKYQNINAFWDAILTRYKDNPYVWVNYVNEPIGDFAKDRPLWRQLGDQQYQRVRAIAPNKIFVYDMPLWGQAINEMAQSTIGEDFLQGKSNVVFSWHNYGGAIKYPGWDLGSYNEISQWSQTLRNKNIPVIIGEFGRSSEPNTPEWVHGGHGAQIDMAADWTFDKWWEFGFGGLWWHGTGTNPADNWNLRMGIDAWYNNASALSASGQRLKNIPSQKPANF